MIVLCLRLTALVMLVPIIKGPDCSRHLRGASFTSLSQFPPSNGSPLDALPASGEQLREEDVDGSREEVQQPLQAVVALLSLRSWKRSTQI